MNTDDEIYETELDSKHIVAPFGSVHRFQCEHGCEGKLWTVETVPTDRICPVCGGAIVPNTKDCEKYVESGYLQDWQAYTDWLTHTLNQEMTILELGVGFEMPSVVRWPFERIAFLNQKAHFIRVHKIWHQLSEELSETNRAKSVASDSCGLFAEEREQKEEKDGSNQQ